MMEVEEYFESKKRELQPNPLGITLKQVAKFLVEGKPLTVELEPGDATRYELALIPMWADLMNLGNYGEERETSLLVVRSVGGTPTTAQVVLLERDFKELYRISNQNEWTEQLFSWWFSLLWREIEFLKRAPNSTVELVHLPYPWCRQPEICAGRGSCPRDPNCGD